MAVCEGWEGIERAKGDDEMRYEIKKVWSDRSALGHMIYQVVDITTNEAKGSRINLEGAKELIARLEMMK